ncbi:MAG: hypothetical protein H0T46_32700 [Deltaproteobacteria bacterium]|nr:hypothetical protein [Deltaproteobacteria bacterium]
MKTTVEIADPLFAEARREAQRSGATLRELIEAGLRKVLDERQRARTKPFRLRDGSFRGGGAHPGVRIDDGRALLAYARMGLPGEPDTIEAVHAMLDAEEEP